MSLRGLIYDAVRLARGATGLGRSRNYRHIEVAVVLVPPEHVQRSVRQWQLGILRRHGHCPGIDAVPHVSLKLGFRSERVERLADWLVSFAAQCEPVELLLKDFDVFDEGIVFMDVKQSPSYEALRQSVLRSLASEHAIEPRPIEGDGFHPHMTLARDLPRREFLAEKSRFSGLEAEFHCLADEIALLTLIDDRWIKYLGCRLKPKRPLAVKSSAQHADDRR